MKIINYLFVLLFIASLSQGEVSQQNEALFQAIEKCDFRGVNVALYKGASVNAIHEKTGDNPAFFAVKKMLKIILEVNDNCYITSVPTNYWLKQLTRGAIAMSQVISIIAIWSLIEARVSKQSDFKKGILSTATVAGVFLGIGILEFYVRSYHQNKNLKGISEIVHFLLMSSELDRSYKHPQIKADLKGFINMILNIKPSGEFQLVRNFELFGKFIDVAYKLILDKSETIYFSQKAYHEHVKPSFEKIALNCG